MEIEELKQMIEANDAGEFIALKIRHFSSVTKPMKSIISGGAQLSHREKNMNNGEMDMKKKLQME